MPKRVKDPKLNPDTGCLEWQGYIDPSTGYGQCWDPIIKRKEHAHRKEWRRIKGAIPDGIEIHHKCGVRHCVEIDHLEALTRRGHGRLTGRAKINFKQARLIRKRLKDGERASDLAKEYGLAPQTISDIRAGRSWTDEVTCPNCKHTFDPYELD